MGRHADNAGLPARSFESPSHALTRHRPRGVEVFLPTVTRWSRWKDRKKAVDWPLFNGYVFARFDPAEHLHVLGCRSVAGIPAGFQCLPAFFQPSV
jgi:hypothetical protein